MTASTWKKKKSKVSFLRPKSLTHYGLHARPSCLFSDSFTLSFRVPHPFPGVVICETCSDHALVETTMTADEKALTSEDQIVSGLLSPPVHLHCLGNVFVASLMRVAALDFTEGSPTPKFRRCSTSAPAHAHVQTSSHHLWITELVFFVPTWGKEIPNCHSTYSIKKDDANIFLPNLDMELLQSSLSEL